MPYQTTISHRYNDSDEYSSRLVDCDIFVHEPDEYNRYFKVDVEVVRDAVTGESLLVSDDEIFRITNRLEGMLERYGMIVDA